MEDFVGFRFGNIHTKDLHLKVVSASNRYQKDLLPSPTDYTVDVPGGDGKYYFGQTFQPREIKVNVAFDNVDESTWRKMAQLFATDHLKDLVFDENPYKTYRAKVKTAPDFKFICFRDRNTQERIYKGEGTLTFICYHPLAYCFNKYVVRAADYYKCTLPENIIDPKSITFNKYRAKKTQPHKLLPGEIKDHYNWETHLYKNNNCEDPENGIPLYYKYPNMNSGWPGGYPTIDQVHWGELYFRDPQDKTNKLIIDVRGYWDNIPKWESTAKLLTTPTLDYDQELIYLPQYSKTNFYNMEMGLKRENGLIGSRLLVYNPGDVPVDFVLRLNNIDNEHKRSVWDVNDSKGRNPDYYRFRISRYNVQRLTLQQAIDWTNLKAYDVDDQKDNRKKYGPNYFTVAEKGDIIDPNDIDNIVKPSYRKLQAAHPHHAYIVEPIPKEHLAHFIKLFYWQTTRYNDSGLSYARGIDFANRYQELYDLCISDDERYELYWDTLDKLLNCYAVANPNVFSSGYTLEDFKYDFIHNPLEYLRVDDTLDYGKFHFNARMMPQYMTFDYFEINNDNFEKLVKGGVDDKSLFLDTERRMLYNIVAPDEEEPKPFDWQVEYKPKKNLYNENIEKGHWFQLPPGWSLIDISPLIEEDVWGGKRWLDARPFTWGNTSEANRRKYNKLYRLSAALYLSQNQPQKIFERYANEPLHNKNIENNGNITVVNGVSSVLHSDLFPSNNYHNKEDIYNFIMGLDISDVDSYLQFRLWHGSADSNGDILTNNYYDYEKYNANNQNALGYQLYQYRWEKDEIGFLKTLAEIWRINGLDSNGLVKNDVNEWWWFANNYIWDNFPPVYWGYADLLSNTTIKYVPQYY